MQIRQAAARTSEARSDKALIVSIILRSMMKWAGSATNNCANRPSPVWFRHRNLAMSLHLPPAAGRRIIAQLVPFGRCKSAPKTRWLPGSTSAKGTSGYFG